MLAFPLSNKIYLSVIASILLNLLRLKPEYFFRTPGIYSSFKLCVNSMISLKMKLTRHWTLPRFPFHRPRF